MEQGYRAVTTRQIADACGLTQPALYHYFADKHDLYVAVMQEELARSKVALERIARRDESIEERLRRAVRYLMGTTYRDHMLMMHDIRYEVRQEAQQQLQEAFRASVVAPLTTIFDDGIRQGILPDAVACSVDSKTAAYLFLSMLTRFTNVARSQETSSSAEHAEIVVKVLLYGLTRAKCDEG